MPYPDDSSYDSEDDYDNDEQDGDLINGYENSYNSENQNSAYNNNSNQDYNINGNNDNRGYKYNPTIPQRSRDKDPRPAAIQEFRVTKSQNLPPSKEVEDAISKIINKVVDFEVKNKTARFYSIQSIMEKVARYNPSFYSGVMHAYLTSHPSFLQKEIQLIARVCGWPSDARSARTSLHLEVVQAIANELLIAETLKS